MKHFNFKSAASFRFEHLTVVCSFQLSTYKFNLTEEDFLELNFVKLFVVVLPTMLASTVSRAILRTIIKCNFSTTTASSSPKVAVVLSGSGVYDGSEIHETSACLVHLTRGGAEPVIYAPDAGQMHVINHLKGEPSANESRNVLAESARIARGKISSLSQLKSCDAIVFPGGFGVAKNLSNFATDGANCKINAEVEAVIKRFHSEKKPIGLCCIAPVLVAKLIPGVEITLGLDKDDGSGHWPYAGTADVAKQWGAIHHNRKVDISFPF
ncbi:Glutamine amidotransferase-like class 1 domain-containing protein 3A, mitochondrial, variant 2 [Chamberlinius hualienensis]